MGRHRPDLAPELRTFAAADYVILYSIEEDKEREESVHIHYVFRGGQDIESLFQL